MGGAICKCSPVLSFSANSHEFLARPANELASAFGNSRHKRPRYSSDNDEKITGRFLEQALLLEWISPWRDATRNFISQKIKNKNGNFVPFSYSLIFFRERINISKDFVNDTSSIVFPWIVSNSPREQHRPIWRFNPLPSIASRNGKIMEFDVDPLETGKGSLCPFFICGMAQWPPPNIYFFVRTVSLNGDDNLVKMAQWHNRSQLRLQMEKVKRPDCGSWRFPPQTTFRLTLLQSS